MSGIEWNKIADCRAGSAPTIAGASPVDGGREEGRAAARPRPASPPSLECLRNTVRKEEVKIVGEDQPKKPRPVTHIIADRCRDWFCPHCAGIQGPRLRARLIDRVEAWTDSYMLTFTIDRTFFGSPEEAFKHVGKQRAIARVMKELRPYLNRPDWFCVVEWQKDGGWPHFHVLCDAKFVPIAAARKAWGRFVPHQLRHLIRPKIGSLGIVRFSKPGKFQNAKHAALYASKYLTKYPEEGFPAWVLEATYRIRRYSTSRGFWGKLSHRTEPDPDDEPRTCRKRSHAQRVKECCQTSSVYDVTEDIDRETGEVKRNRRFLGRLMYHAGNISEILRNLAADVKDLGGRLGLFIRGRFISYLGTWQQFAGNFTSLLENDVVEMAGMSMRLIGWRGTACNST